MRVLNFTDKEGLPRNIVSCFELDEFGYGWVGTGNGIARFDGYNFVTYQLLRGRIINKIVINNNIVWVATDQGLYIYNRITDTFELIRNGYIKDLRCFKNELFFIMTDKLVKLSEEQEFTEFSISKINSFEVTDEGIWYNAGNNGLQMLNSSTQYFHNRVINLIKEIDNNLWIAFRNGDLFRIDPSENISKIHTMNRHNIMDIEQINGKIFLATDGNGILLLDEDGTLIGHWKKEQNKSSKIPSNSIYNISKGLNGTIWISTYGAGLTCLINENNAFINFTPIPGNPNSLIDKEGISVFAQENSIYLGTNYGFSIWNNDNKKFQNINANQLIGQLQGSKVTAVESRDEELWIATYDGLLGKYSKDLKLISKYNPCSEKDNEMQRIILLYNLDEETMLIGSHFRDKSLLKFNTKSGQLSVVQQVSKELNNTNFQINSIRKNQSGEIMALIRNSGLFLYNNQQNVLENVMPEINNRVTFKLNDFYNDKDGYYWFTTQADGLIRLSPDGRSFDKWTIEQGFPTNSLLRIESTNDSVLWISTIEGLCSFNRQSEQIQIYNYRHGLASNEFLSRTSAKTFDNQLIFGNSEGFTILKPDEIVSDTSSSEIIISDLRFHNKSIKALKKENYLEFPLEQTKKLKLPFSRNSFTISFFTKDNNLPKFNNFAYRLSGLERDWIYLGENNQTTYTNLSPGKYIFQVKSTNKNNFWNDNATSLEIQILPPWYLTWLAFIFYFLFIISNIILVFRFYSRRVQLKKEVEISEYKVKKEHELTENKLAFFTNISHDLKTPLTLISAPINDLLQSDNLDRDQIKKLDVAKRNAARLYKLISDLIDFRKITQRQLPLQTQSTDLKPVIENIFEAFRIECKKRDLDFIFHFNLTENVFVDIKKVEKILWNLLANAIKFTSDSGKVWLTVKSVLRNNEKYLFLEVGDMGKGFSEEEKKNIFDRFYQVQKSDNIKFEGSGIGLSIVHDLVEIHRGKIDVQSEQAKGSIFTLTIPAEEKHYSSEEKISIFAPEEKELYDESNTETSTEDSVQTSAYAKKYSLPKILIVEDNKELREYLGSHFNKAYKVYQADNGADGLKLANTKEPDLILTDIQMPVMDGIEFSIKVRENFSLAHTPIIMLTAHDTTEQKIKGLSSGADSYVTKPFEIQYLDAVAKSLLDNRKRAKEKFLGIEPVKGEFEKYSASDIEFINKLKEFIFENITNENLNIELLSKHFNISRTQLNRKIKALTNSTPNNYIRTIRLKKAYELIKVKHVRVSEAAYETGFTDPNYFTFCFKKEFGENPSKI
ncbi:MAG: response regulator [Bacteroidetes bacterium]|nr:response regulator [Bacteroidota bacterium]